jgi:hypothetical protein
MRLRNYVYKVLIFKTFYSVKTLSIVETSMPNSYLIHSQVSNIFSLIKIAPESALKFAAYDTFKRLIKGDADRDIQTWERFLAGSMAGGVSQSAIYPLEVSYTLKLIIYVRHSDLGIVSCRIKCWRSLTDGHVLIRGC